MAGLLRGGLLPHAYGYPADMRAPRGLLRRRRPLLRKRAEPLAHLHKPNSPYHLPEIRKKLAAKANRAGVAERLPAPAVQQSLAVDRALIDAYDRLLPDVARSLVNTAEAQGAPPVSRRRALPGGGTLLSLVILSASHDTHRCPRGQGFVSSGRRVKGAKESAGTRSGTSGQKRGHAYLKRALSAAAVVFLRQNPAAQQDRTR